MNEATREAGPALWARAVVGCVGAALAGPALVVAPFACGLPVAAAVPIVLALVATCAWHPALLSRLAARLPQSRAWLVSWLIVSAIAGAPNARLAVFMIDPSRAD